MKFDIPTPTPEVAPSPPVVEDVVEENTEGEPVSTLTLALALPTERPRCFYTASLWHIEPAPGIDMIHAVHSQTHDIFDGPISDFNEMLRGN